jgi:putative SOS response-associated peptidase YedK
MCYHYSISKTASEIATRYNIDLRFPEINPEPVYYHVNGFDFSLLPVVYKDNKSDYLKLELMQWGLVPGWVKGEEQAQKIRSRTLNARSETAGSKPSFRAAFRHRPCLVPASGYFEWMHHKGDKYPFFIHLTTSGIFSFAGIWEEWVNEFTGEILRSFSILTCDANSLAARIHNSKKRMPVILEIKHEKKWLSSGSGTADRRQLLKPFDSEEMDAYSIGRLISSKGKNTNIPEVLDPFVYPELV